MSAIAIFSCRPNSHPFQERHVTVSEPVKIGRSVARSRPVPNNAIFDCKVLSRNHALLWYDDGVFYLQDTKSSNGTFVNNQRLSKGSEESAPRELYSGDIVQFGVDVMENSRRVTHSCIIAQVQLFHPDNREATNDHSSAFLTSGAGALGAQSQELYQIAQYLQEALHREQMLENKLATLQRLVSQTQEASDSGWQALIDEDRLLSRLEVLENQLAAYSKNQTEDTLRQELTHLQEDKYNYETRAKESLHKVLQEKFDAVRKLSDLERSLSNTEDECSHLREMCETSQQELQTLAEKHSEKVKEFDTLQTDLEEAERRHNDTLETVEEEKSELQQRLNELTEEEHNLQAKVEALEANNDFTKEQLTNMKAKMEALRENNGDTPRICEQENRGIQVDMVNLLDLQLLNARDSQESDTDESSDDDELKEKVKDILDCLDDSLEGRNNSLEGRNNSLERRNNKEIQNDSDTCKDNDTLDPEELKATVCESTSSRHHQEKLKQAQAKIESYKNQLELSSLKLKESHNKVETLHGELEKARCEISTKVARISLLEERLKQSDDSVNNLVENAVTDLKSQLQETKKQAEASTALSQQLRAEIERLESEMGEYRGMTEPEVVTPVNTSPPTLNLNHTDPQQELTQEINNLKDLLEKKDNDKVVREEELQRYKADLLSSREKITEVSGEVSNLRSQLEDAKKTARDKLDQNTKLRDQLSELEMSSKDVRQQIISLRGELREAKLNGEQAQGEADKLQLQVRSLQEELDYVQSIKGSTDVADANKELQAHASQTRREFLSLKEECDSLRKRVQSIEEEMGSSRRENSQLLTNYCTLQESYRELELLKERLIKERIEDKDLAWQLNMTDSQKESDQSKQLVEGESSVLDHSTLDGDRSIVELEVCARLQLVEGESSILDHSTLDGDRSIVELEEECHQYRSEISRLEDSLHEMTEEYEFLAYKSHTISAVAILPLLVVVFAVFLAFLPLLSAITATSSPTLPSNQS